MTMAADGTVVSSSQQTSRMWEGGKRMLPMQGIILAVYPSDAKENLSADNSSIRRGPHHMCSVLAVDHFGNPDVPLHNVIIPPAHHSGIDNFSEDLPRGCSKDLIDGTNYDLDFVDVDTSKLDGEWCIVSFVGGKIDHAYVSGWWPHPYNNFDPATTGRAYRDTSLKQVDLEKNRFRVLRRINGTEFVVNPQGSVYLDTQQAARTVQVVETSPQASQIDKGGHVQVDVKPTGQLELNWNAKPTSGARIGAGSNSASPVHDPALPQNQPLDSETPEARQTSRTFVRGKAYELLLKTSNLSIFCEDTDDKPGDYIVLAHNGVTISQQPKDGSKSAAVINIADGGISIQAQDGSLVSVTDDQIVLIDKSGAQVSLVGGQVLISGSGGVSIPTPTTVGAGVAGAPPVDAAVLGTKLLTALATIVPVPNDGGAAVLAGLAAALTESLSTQVKIGA